MTDFRPFVVESLLTRADFAALQKAWVERARARVGRARLLGATIGPLLAAAGLVHTLRSGRGPFAFAAFLIGVCGMLASTTWATHLFRAWSLPDDDGLILGRVRTELSTEGIRTSRDNSASLTQWSALKDVTCTDTHVFLWVDRLSAFILPVRDLPEGLDGATARERVRGWAGRQGEASQESSASAALLGRVSAHESAPSGVRHGFLGTLVRRLTCRAVPAEGPGSSDAMILLCAGTGLAVWLAFDLYAAGPGAQWYAGGVAGIAWYATGLLALAWVMHRASEGTAGFRALLATIVTGVPLPLAFGLALQNWAPASTRWAGYALLGTAAIVHLQRNLTRLSGSRQPRAMLAGVLLALAFAWGTGNAWIYPHFWFAADADEEEESGSRVEMERLLFEQADRIDAAAARMSAGTVDRPDVFFVGFAGVGEQKVFAEEIKLSERVVTGRYGAMGRALLLVNDRRDRDTWPLATVQGLRRALARVGEHMDRSEDVLFLVLTSHGSDEPSLSVSNGTWPLAQLDAVALRAALDDARIKWRVIVISACHSGAFIRRLADDNTIILTSAAGDRASFGCGNEREVTDFGAAFVRDALPEALSLASAFDEAKRTIAAREQRGAVEASLPQAHFGSAIRSHWELIEAERGASLTR